MLKTSLSRSLYLILFLALIVGIERNVGTAEYFNDMKYEVDHHTLTVKLTREARWLKEIQCLARNVHYEARGESLDGQLAVAKVTLNRTESGLFPNSVCGVVNEGKNNDRGYYVCQFSWRCESWNNPNRKFNSGDLSYQVAMDVILNYDKVDVVSDDTYWFHANHVKPSWRKHKEKIAKVDGHIFYKNKPGVDQR